jgi:hypothetical protein
MKFLQLDSLAGAPATDEFNAALGALQGGRTFRQDHTSVVNSRKQRQMFWCLAEALKEIERKFLREAVTMVLHRDEREQRLLLRYGACTGKLETRRSMLGQAKNFGAGAVNISKATIDIIENLCTPLAGLENLVPDVDPKVDQQLFTHILNIIEIINNDAAADKMLSAAQLEGRRGNRSGFGGLAPRLPNLKLIAWDKAHGARRSAWLDYGYGRCHLMRVCT